MKRIFSKPVLFTFAIAALSCMLTIAHAQTPAAPKGKRKAKAAAAAEIDPKFAFPGSTDDLPGAGPLGSSPAHALLWGSRRTAWSKRAEQDKGAVVFLGDSITQGWGDDFSQRFAGVNAANRGIGGDTSRGVLTRLANDVLALDPAAVVLLIGTNDIGLGAEPETIVGNIRLILDAIEKHDAKTPIIVCQVLPSSATRDRPSDKIKRVNELLAAAVKGDSHVTLLETWTLFADANGDAPKALFPDLLHLNGDAYAMWAAAIRPVLATHGLMENDSDDFAPEEGFVSLFNGRDLTGWGFRDLKTLAKQADFDGQAASADGRYVARNGRLIVVTPPEGRKTAQLWTTRDFPKNFTLKLEFRATPNADSGVFLRRPQLQCRDYPLAGPYKNLTKYKPQDWNELVVVVNDGVAHCTCNGEVLEASLKLPESGPIGLEGDRGQMEYRRIRVREE